MPFDHYFDDTVEDLSWLRRVLDDSGSGFNRPAAVIVETVQGEGGVDVTRTSWLRALAELCTDHEILLIVDDVQMGCGRTGPFFSFEQAGIVPDIVCLSKSISGYGAPMALMLFTPELDIWEPGEHNGTFRGYNPAFVTATAALEQYWSDDALERSALAHGEYLGRCLSEITAQYEEVTTRGRGLVHGLVFADPAHAAEVTGLAFDNGLLAETAGADDRVVKLLPSLTITLDELDRGVQILADATATVCTRS